MSDEAVRPADHHRDQPTIIGYGDDPSQFVALWWPETPPAGVAVLIHGGYWRDRYHLDLMDPMAAHLVGNGWVVVNLEYRRIQAPDGAQPDGVWDAMSADVLAGIQAGGEAVLDHGNDGREGGGPGLPVVLIGHSAGGQLALWAARQVQTELVVALAPLADLAEADRRSLSNGATGLLLGGGHLDVPGRYAEASPRERLPLGARQVVIHGRDDEDVPHAISGAYAAAASAAGDDVEFLDPTCVDHFHIIDPGHWIWRAVDRRLGLVSGYAHL